MENQSTTNLSSSSSKLELSPCIFSHKISIKLSESNFLTWKQEVLTAIREHKLSKHVEDPKSFPPKFLSPEDEERGQYNQDYLDFLLQDQMLMSWLLFSMTQAMFARMMDCKSAYQIWEKVEIFFASQTKAEPSISSVEMETGLRQQIVLMKLSFFVQGLLSQSQLQRLERLQDKRNPYFVQEIFDLFFRDTTRQFTEIERALNQDPGKQKENIGRLIHRLKGSVLSAGALKILYEVNQMSKFWEENNLEGTIAAFEQVKVERETLKAKLEPYFQLVREVGPSETAQRPK